MRKSVRDGGITGGATSLALSLLVYFGMDAVLAGIVAPAAGVAAAMGYRVLRRNWPWLLDADPGSV